MDLTIVWAFILAFAVAFYVIMDGFDLGIGILFPVFPVGPQRNQAMNSIAPVWDGNETWLVLGGGGLLAAFPLAYSIILPALYAPLIAMLLGLIFRGVAFEFRWRDPGHRRIWDSGFCLGSLGATFAQGIVLGALLQGIEVDGRSYGGGWWDWLTPFTLLTGASLVVGYAMLGLGWLIWKTEGELQLLARRLARPFTLALLAAIGAVSLYNLTLLPQYAERWLDTPGLFVSLPMPALVGLVALFLWRSIGRGADWRPFALTLLLFLLSMIGLAISIWPDVIPGQMSIWEGAAPYSSQLFMLVGALILLPMILAYTGWAYWVFRGKVDEDHYH